MCKDRNYKFCAVKAQKLKEEKQKGPFGRNGEPIFVERGVSASGNIIGINR